MHVCLIRYTRGLRPTASVLLPSYYRCLPLLIHRWCNYRRDTPSKSRRHARSRTSHSLSLSDSHRHREGRDARVTLASSGTSSARNGIQTFNRHLSEFERAKRRSTMIVAWSDVIRAMISWFVAIVPPPAAIVAPTNRYDRYDTLETSFT